MLIYWAAEAGSLVVSSFSLPLLFILSLPPVYILDKGDDFEEAGKCQVRGEDEVKSVQRPSPQLLEPVDGSEISLLMGFL